MAGLERYRSELNGIRVPIITTYTPPDVAARVHKPTDENLEGPIFGALRRQIQMGIRPILESETHALRGIGSLVPHHKGEKDGDNMVYWVTQRTKDGKDIKPWIQKNNKSWRVFARDRNFQNGIEAFARETIAATNGSFFFVYGWQPEEKNPLPFVTSRGAMSQARAHQHHMGADDPSHFDDYMQLYEGMSAPDIFSWALFLNYGAEVGNREMHHRLRHFGGTDFANHEHTWVQRNGVMRHAYGFNHLNEVIPQLVAFDDQINPIWQKNLSHVVKENTREYIFPFAEGAQSLLRVAPRFTAAVWFTNPLDRLRMGLQPDDNRIWVEPFSLTDKKALVGGYWTNRKVGLPPP